MCNDMNEVSGNKVVRVVGQSPKWRRADGSLIGYAHDGEVLVDTTYYLSIESGGGFDDESETIIFREINTRVKIVSKGDASSYAVTDVILPEIAVTAPTTAKDDEMLAFGSRYRMDDMGEIYRPFYCETIEECCISCDAHKAPRAWRVVHIQSGKVVTTMSSPD